MSSLILVVDERLIQDFLGKVALKQSCSLLFLNYRYELKPCSICHGELKDPVELCCSHAFCEKCIRSWLIPAHMHCPLCRVAVEDDNLTVNKELRYSYLCKVSALQWGWLCKEILICSVRSSTHAQRVEEEALLISSSSWNRFDPFPLHCFKRGEKLPLAHVMRLIAKPCKLRAEAALRRLQGPLCGWTGQGSCSSPQTALW